MKPIVITDVDSDENRVEFQLPGGTVVKVPRLDFIDEDTFDALNSELEALDVKQQLVAVANDICAAAPGAKLQWQPLLDATKQTLTGLGVDITRIVANGTRYDEVTAPTDDVVDAVKLHSGQKPLPLRKRGREIALTMLKHVVDEDEYALFETLRVGQLDKVLAEWRKHSTVTLGE